MKYLMIAFFYSLVSVQAYALAPVIDDSENFVILDGQQANTDQPVAPSNDDESSWDEKPLAHDEPTTNQTRVELLDKIQGMQQDIQELRGQLEMQSHDLKLLKDQQLAFYKDLDTRLRHTPTTEAGTNPLNQGSSTSMSPTELSLNQAQSKLNTPSNTSTQTTQLEPTSEAPSSPVSSFRHNPADEQISYMAAYELIKNKQFEEAIHSMQAFITQYPNGAYTANAQYWLGELYMVQKNYQEAIQHFDIVLNQYPNSSKTAASLLKVGYALAASGKDLEAKQKLNQVIKNYPDTTTAQLAKAKLKSLHAS